MQFDRRKLADLVVHVAATVGPADVGQVKLHKVAYFADMLAWLDRRVPVTGATYRKRPHGPTCDALPGVLRELEEAGTIRIGRTDFYGYQKTEIAVLAAPASTRLDAYEIGLINEVADFVCRRNTASTISELTHDGPWRLVGYGDEIPYATAQLLVPMEVSEEALAWALGEGAEGEDPRSATNTVELFPFGTLRERLAARLKTVPA